MANIKSAKKRAVQTKKRELVNLARLTEIKTYTKKVLKALDDKNIEEAKSLLKIAEAKISRAKGKRTLKANTASRKVSKLAKKVAAATK
ncbi:MAG: 30S ribosomal protein S20 [candidate division TM6 bacterium GW2011_GWF2_37_49]|nr:MAG: 30S ribosomal protein S20 [candidate division TM6 bacterium GW2011_GWF2_37_49]